MKNILKQIVTFLLQKEAELVLKKYKPKIVAITGSVGKTSTKDAIYTAMSAFYFCRKSQKSFNSELGVPLTVLGIPSAEESSVSLKSFLGWTKNILDGLEVFLLPHHYPEWLILEVGTDRPGDIESVTKWVKPDITVVTKLSKIPVHVEFFSSPEDLFNEKGNLVKALKPGGTLLLNADDEDVLAYKNISDENTLLFGKTIDADVVSKDYQIVYDENKLPKGIKFGVLVGKENFEIELNGTLGSHHAYHVLAALGVIKALDNNLKIAVKSFQNHSRTPGRMSLVPGLKDTMIIDDTYNSSPVAMSEALNTLKEVKAKRKIAVLGDMLELGKYSLDAHKKVGEEVSNVADILVTVGLRSRSIAENALNFGFDEKNVFQFEDSQEAGKFLQNLIKKGDVILIKGSQGIRMEKIVGEIMANPEKKAELLVRQTGLWEKR